MCAGRWLYDWSIPSPIAVCWIAGFLVFGIRGLLWCTSPSVVRKGAVLVGIALGAFASMVEGVTASEWSQRSLPQWACVELEVLQSWPSRGQKPHAIAWAEGWGRLVVEGTGVMIPGQTLEAHVRCRRPEVPLYAFGFDERRFLQGRGIRFKCETLWMGEPSPPRSVPGKIRYRIQQLRDAMLARYRGLPEGDARALIIALASGDRSSMSRPLRKTFADLGLGHMTAVSGFHTGLVAGFLLLLLRGLGISRRWTPWILVPILWLFVGLCGFPQSAVRALGMATLASWGLSRGRRPHAMTVLAFVGICMWAVSPHLVHDLGVSLSFLATAGILSLHARSIRVKSKSKWVNGLWMAAAVPVVATAYTAPIAWDAFGKIPWLFLPANLVAAPWVTVLAGMTAVWWVVPPPFSEPMQALLIGATDLLIQCAQKAGDGPVFLLPLGAESVKSAGACVALGAFLALRRRGAVLYLAAGILTACALLRHQHYVEQAPRQFALNQCVLSFDGASWVVFPDHPGGYMKWETRSMLERVSHDSPECTRWCGTRLAFSQNELRYRGQDRSWSWVSSSRKHCGLPDPHKPPKPPCP